MDRDQKLMALLEGLGEDTDVEFANSMLESHDWDVEATLLSITGGGAGGGAGAGPPAEQVDAEGYRAPLRTGYTDRLLGPDPAELYAQAAMQQAMQAGYGEPGHPGGGGSRDAAMQQAIAASMGGNVRMSDRDDQGQLAQAMEASYTAAQQADGRRLSANAQQAMRAEQDEIARAIEASYQEQSGADAAFRQQMAQAEAASLGAAGASGGLPSAFPPSPSGAVPLQPGFAARPAAVLPNSPLVAPGMAGVGPTASSPRSSQTGVAASPATRGAGLAGRPLLQGGPPSPSNGAAGMPVASRVAPLEAQPQPKLPRRLPGAGMVSHAVDHRSSTASGTPTSAASAASPLSGAQGVASFAAPPVAVPVASTRTGAAAAVQRTSPQPQHRVSIGAAASGRTTVMSTASAGGGAAQAPAMRPPQSSPPAGIQSRVPRTSHTHAQQAQAQQLPAPRPAPGGHSPCGAAAGDGRVSINSRPSVPEDAAAAQQRNSASGRRHAAPGAPSSTAPSGVSPSMAAAAGGSLRPAGGRSPNPYQQAAPGATSVSRRDPGQQDLDRRRQPAETDRLAEQQRVDQVRTAERAAIAAEQEQRRREVEGREAATQEQAELAEARRRQQETKEQQKRAAREAEAAGAAEQQRRQQQEADRRRQEAAEQAEQQRRQQAEREAEQQRQAEQEVQRRQRALAEAERKRREQVEAEIQSQQSQEEAQQRRQQDAAEAEAQKQEAKRRAEKEAAELQREREEAAERDRDAQRVAQPEDKGTDGVVQALVALRKRYKDSDPAGLATCLQTLRAYISNLAKNPSEPKFQRINCDNNAFRTRVGAFEGGAAVLEACGFASEGSVLAVTADFARSKGPRFWDALAKVDVLIDQCKS